MEKIRNLRDVDAIDLERAAERIYGKSFREVKAVEQSWLFVTLSDGFTVTAHRLDVLCALAELDDDEVDPDDRDRAEQVDPDEEVYDPSREYVRRFPVEEGDESRWHVVDRDPDEGVGRVYTGPVDKAAGEYAVAMGLKADAGPVLDLEPHDRWACSLCDGHKVVAIPDDTAAGAAVSMALGDVMRRRRGPVGTTETWEDGYMTKDGEVVPR